MFKSHENNSTLLLNKNLKHKKIIKKIKENILVYDIHNVTNLLLQTYEKLYFFEIQPNLNNYGVDSDNLNTIITYKYIFL